MDDEAELDEERRRNRINMASASQKIKKSQKKQRRKELFKLALKDVVRQIKVTILIVAVVSILILILCTSAWYILESNEKNDKKQKIKSLVTLVGMADNEDAIKIMKYDEKISKITNKFDIKSLKKYQNMV